MNDLSERKILLCVFALCVSFLDTAGVTCFAIKTCIRAPRYTIRNKKVKTTALNRCLSLLVTPSTLWTC